MASASHLAPFVAAVMRDKTVEELMAKVKEQQQQLKDTMKVEITGPGGTPVYTKGQFENGEWDWGDLGAWRITQLEKVEDCPVNKLTRVEVWIGGIFQTTLNPVND